MFAGVADTHAALWYLFRDARLSAAAKEFIDEAAAAPRKIALSAISLAEIVYLVEKQRIAPTAFDDIRRALSNPNHVFQEVPFTTRVVEAMRQIPRDTVPDMPDRIVAAFSVCRSLAATGRSEPLTSKQFGRSGQSA